MKNGQEGMIGLRSPCLQGPPVQKCQVSTMTASIPRTVPKLTLRPLRNSQNGRPWLGYSDLAGEGVWRRGLAPRLGEASLPAVDDRTLHTKTRGFFGSNC